MDNIERNNESRHTLFSSKFGFLEIQEPKGWESDTKSFERDKDSKGILSKITIDLEFFGNGAEFLTNIFYAYGIQETVYLYKEEKNIRSINEEWKLRYVQEIDMATFKRDEKTGGVTVMATEGGLYDKIKNRQSDKYNIINTLSADGIDIGTLKTYPFEPKPRGIFLESLFQDKKTRYQLNSRVFQSNGSVSETTRTVPLKNVYISDPDNVYYPYNSSDSNNATQPHDPNYAIGTPQNMGDLFYLRSDIDRRIKVIFDIEYKITGRYERNTSDIIGRKYFLEFRRSALSGADDLLVERTILQQFDIDANIGVLKTYHFEQYIDLKPGESLSIVFATKMTVSGAGGSATGYMETYTDVLKSNLLVQDSTSYPPTISKCIKPFDLFERIVAKITGKTGLFKSNIFDKGGEYENMVVDNGFWARGFPDSVIESDEEPREIQFNLSFKDAFESFNYLEPLAWFIQIDGKKEVVRIEKATYTMKNFIGVTLDEVDKIVNEASKPDFFSSIEIGHKKEMQYEEVNGLDEPNGKSEFTTHITKNESKYMALSEMRVDAVGYELIRRKDYKNYPKEDTPRDSHIWMHDAKYVQGTYYHKLWADNFDAPPTGIYDPETAWNLRLSPMNRLYYGHGYSIARGLYHYQTKKVRFNSSNANQNLKTTKNSVTLNEGGEDSFILVSDLGKPRVEAHKVEMVFALTQELEDQISGATIIDGEEVPNVFGLFRYKEKGEYSYGRLVKLETSEESKLTLMKARL